MATSGILVLIAYALGYGMAILQQRINRTHDYD
jgi:hypothetical protein